jgi:lysophospholipase L1-like esterase
MTPNALTTRADRPVEPSSITGLLRPAPRHAAEGARKTSRKASLLLATAWSRSRTVYVASLALVALVALPSHAFAQRIMIIGDSIQSGTGLKRTSSQASDRLQRLANVVVHNFASPGARLTDGFYPGMKHAVDAVWLLHGFFGMQGVVIAIGTNDWAAGVDLAVFSQDYRDFLAALPPTLPVACMGMVWRADEGVPNATGLTLDDFRTAIRDACATRGKPYLEGKDAIPNSAAYFVDGIHPNDRGHRVMGAFLQRELRGLGWIP